MQERNIIYRSLIFTSSGNYNKQDNGKNQNGTGRILRIAAGIIVLAILLLGVTTGTTTSIWDEASGSSVPFTWDYTNFESFNVSRTGTETMSIVQADLGFGAGKSRTIRGGSDPSGAGLIYTTTRQVIEYEFSKNRGLPVESALSSAGSKVPLGKYYAKVNLFGKPYAGLNGKANRLSEIIIEQDSAITSKKILGVGETWDVGNGWALTAQSIDAKATPRQVWITLSYNGQKLDDKILAQGNVYTYVEKNIAGELDVPQFVTYVDAIFSGATTDMVQLRYTWAVSRYVLDISAGNIYGIFKVVNATADTIKAENGQAITLSPNTTIPLVNTMALKVLDDASFLKFHPVIAGAVPAGNENMVIISQYVGNDSVVQRNEAARAINDYFSGLITKQDAVDVVYLLPIPSLTPPPPPYPVPPPMKPSLIELIPQYKDIQLAPGENYSFRAVLRYRGNETVAVRADVQSEMNLISVEPSFINVSAGGEQVYNITVSVPSNVLTGYYSASIIFSDEGMESQSYLSLSVNVWTPPRVQIFTSYINDRVEPGNNYDYKIQVRSVAETPIPISPSVSRDGVPVPIYFGAGMPSELPADWIAIDSPLVLPPKSISNVTITVRIPGNASSGRYENTVNLNIDDTSISEYDARVQLSLEVQKPPAAPFIKKLNLSKDSAVKIEISAYQYKTEWTRERKKPSFETVVTAPNGSRITLSPLKMIEKGSVYYGISYGRLPSDIVDYNEENIQYTETYKVGLERGQWQIGILPRNADRFEYSIEVE